MITEAFIHEMLDNAKDNGYDWSRSDPTVIAEDMIDLVDGLQACESEDINPYIVTWQKAHA